MKQATGELSSRQKAAILLVSLGTDTASKLLTFMSEDEVESLSLEVARLERIQPEKKEQVLGEFHELCLGQKYIAEGGVDAAQNVLEAAFGGERAKFIIRRVVQALQIVPFDFLKKTDPSQLMSFIQDEHPQTIALILAYLAPDLAANVMSKLPLELRADVAERIASMDRTPPEVIHQVEQVLQKKLSSIVSSNLTSAGGVKALAELLNIVDRATERTILDGLSDTNPELAEEVKKLMFVFEDIMQIDDRAIQQILKEADMKDLALALKGTSHEVQEHIMHNMSERAVDILKEDMEFMGPVKVRNVEEAQQRIVAIIRRLEDAGEIVLSRGAEDEVVV